MTSIRNPFMISETPRWAILTDYPDRADGYNGKLCSSSTYRRMWWAIKRKGMNTNQIATLSASSGIESRRFDDDFDEKITALIERGVRSFLILGEDIYNHLFSEIYTETFAKMRGSFLPHPAYPEVHFIPTYNPRLLNGKRFRTAGSQADLSLVLIYDINRWAEAGEECFKLPEERFNLEPTIEEVEAFVDKAIDEDILLSLDIETTSLRRDRGDIVVLGAAVSEEEAIVIPFLNGTRGPYFRPLENARMKDAVQKLVGNCRQLWQNALFDVPFMRYRGFNVNLDKVEHDTMLAHHALSPELPHNLGFINSCYGRTRYWKDDFLKSNFGILRQDQLDMRRYNARDCVVPLQILPRLLNDLKENKSLDAYAENMSCVRAAVEQTETGIVIDQTELKKLTKGLKEKKKWCEDILYRVGNLPRSFNLNSSQHLAWFLFMESGGMVEKLEELEDKFKPVKMELFLCEKGHKRWTVEDEECDDKPCRYCGSHIFTKTEETKIKQKEEVNKKTGELTGDARSRLLLREILSVKPIIVGKFFGKRNRDTNALILDKRAREALHGRVQEEMARLRMLKRPSDTHYADLKKLKRLSIWIRFFNYYQKIQKNISTYTAYPIWDDSRIHTNILLHGTASGRPASRNPNVKLSAFVKSGELRETVIGKANGNPDPSRGYTLGRCRDYWRGIVLLITSKSARDQVLTNLPKDVKLPKAA